MTTPLDRQLPGQEFDPALRGTARTLQLDDDRVLPLRTRRWRRPAGRGDRWLLDRCEGSTLDLGCGPGRLVAHLVARGIPALGADSSATAIGRCRERGIPAVQGDVFQALPGEGTWRTTVLADGNIGIGGDPLRLLHRVRELLHPDGRLLVETAPDAAGLWRGEARLRDRRGGTGGWFPWAVLDLHALRELAEAIGFRVCAVRQGHYRHFADVRPRTGDDRRLNTPSGGK
ncbi:class I SAM-dependent methyltransferase [Amycolatopsis sp. FBCC-B4732]|uniref:methyltransferase domain-containing protein n=1 Tax=Amycolatopsis sp. FBCC-B4732 TaxID=3079339 RepID=UPI001FF31AE7|nr:methyltransferase domain-containing protein [Amycolatopsis sp. FBCC-B4732]UOX88454.1 class I SAM-dependent methyltransferase [Amycolatopsis sp. FBCC-B4732]